MRHLIRCLPFVPALLLLGSCQTPTAFPEPTAQWETHVGQLQSTAAGKSVIGEVVVRRSGTENFQLSFSSGPGFPLLKLWASGESGRAEGVLARGQWQGLLSQAPSQLQSFTRLPEVFAAISPERPRAQTGAFAAEAQFSGKRLTRLSSTFPATGERLIFVFSR